VVMNQPILFHKLNKKMRSEKKINHFIPQTKHTTRGWRELGGRNALLCYELVIFFTIMFINR
jgi:hypothetical protein